MYLKTFLNVCEEFGFKIEKYDDTINISYSSYDIFYISLNWSKTIVTIKPFIEYTSNCILQVAGITSQIVLNLPGYTSKELKLYLKGQIELAEKYKSKLKKQEIEIKKKELDDEFR